MTASRGTERPPRSEGELFERASRLRGRTLGELAAARGVVMVDHAGSPIELRRSKGLAGQLLELELGATAASRSVPDFERIGVEMKTVPMNRAGQAVESTYVCTVDLLVDPGLDYANSRVRKKLARVLFVPVQSDPALALAERRIGTPVLWSPSLAEDAQLRSDFDELMELVRLGLAATITAHLGVALQIRPKGENRRAEAWSTDENGHRARVLPRGFYLRPAFTAAAIRSCLSAVSDGLGQK